MLHSDKITLTHARGRTQTQTHVEQKLWHKTHGGFVMQSTTPEMLSAFSRDVVIIKKNKD